MIMHILFQVMSFFATAQHEKERLQYFASPEGRDDLYQYNQKERRTVLEVNLRNIIDVFCHFVHCTLLDKLLSLRFNSLGILIYIIYLRFNSSQCEYKFCLICLSKSSNT